MAESDKVKVGEELYVNEATLELLRRRMESDIRRSFMQSIGIPIGGGGIIVLLYVLFAWIPNNVGSLIEENPQIQTQIQNTVTGYLKQEEGVRAIRRQVEASMNNDEVKAEIREAVRGTLEQTVQNLSQNVADNLNQLVAEVSVEKLVGAMDETGDTARVTKGSASSLYQFLESPRAMEIASSGQPLTLGIAIGQGRRYAQKAIEEYIHQLSNRFGKQFRYIVITDSEGEFLALIPHQPFMSQLDGSLMDILNATADRLPIADARQVLAQRFGQQAIAAVSTVWTIGDALSRSWWSTFASEQEVAAIDAQGRLNGVTSRKRIVDAVVRSVV